jgi:hypothetical protein
MKETFVLILWIFALVCFGLRAFGVIGTRVHLGWLGATFVALAAIISSVA